MILLQADKAVGLFSTVAEQGVVFALLVGIIFVLGWVIVRREKYWKLEVEKLEEESKEKSKAHGETMKIKDDKIEELYNEGRDMALKNLSAFKDFIEQIKALRNS